MDAGIEEIALSDEPLLDQQRHDPAFIRLMLTMLKEGLTLAEEADAQTPPNYADRYRAVLGCLHIATAGGLKAGIRIDPKEPEWPVVYIELPTGQVSWHMPQHPIEWDGHSTHTKYERIRAWRPE